ncbi:uncharacterized protein AB675_322 [Cyphellophora attinorum]|uniref:Mid2 domain-containing protein n=1 Tax=Cyphellophora attinorum TaxID=1664694 RepID=A0A0N1HBF4_9EURO|nr:uncharacterized protein AB675_322 [Phialophora attinorum]KPI45913.1 hypothetical protein AB675_322 [Phialophora attinorum]
MSNFTQVCYKGSAPHLAQLRTYTPCDPTSASSMCCRNIEENPNRSVDWCLPNGLCSNFGNDVGSLDGQTYWIESCSDPTWSAEECAPFRRYFQARGCSVDGEGNAQLGYCSETGNYCCRKSSSTNDCCDTSDDDNLVVERPIASIVPATISVAGVVSTVPVPTMLATSTAIPTPTSAVADTTSTGLSVGASVGIGVGATMAVVAPLLGIVYLFMRRKKRKYTSAGLGSGANGYLKSADAATSVVESGGRHRYELPQSPYRQEMQ